jgi:two-component system response regulator MprA
LSGESSSDASANGGSANGEGRSKRSPFSLIILDLMMPQMDGWSFRARQLQQPGLRDIPVVVLSGAYQIEREVRALNPAAVLRKPVGINDLLDTLAPFLEPKLEA